MKLIFSFYMPLCTSFTRRGPELLVFGLDCQGHWALELLVPGACVCLGLASSVLGAELWPSCCVSLSRCLCNMLLLPVCLCRSFDHSCLLKLCLWSLITPVSWNSACGPPRFWELFLNESESLEFQLTWVCEFVVWFTCVSLLVW